ncbi:MAG: stage V sporulation protein T [Firmicutes bacterium]|jgi:AbrB family transcriptional regulator (stage V sporulation protein T)|nr:stage V sporulation protein T [Bacillota bacterium]
MGSTGIVRKIDNLGRLVIPKEVRKTLHIRDGDSLEIFVDSDGEVILKKYSSISELGDFAKEYADSLYEALGHITCIADRDQIIAVSGSPEKEYLNKRIAALVEEVMDERRAVLINQPEQRSSCIVIADEEGKKCRYTAEVIAPIIVEGDPIGAVIIASKKMNPGFGELEFKSAVTAASFLAKQMEQ